MDFQIHSPLSSYQSATSPQLDLSAPSTTSSSYHQHHQLTNSHNYYNLDTHNYSTVYTPSNAYMNPTLPQPPLQVSYQPSSPYHGIKRSAPEPDDDFDRASHISTHFKKLKIQSQQQRTNPNRQANGDFSKSTVPSHGATSEPNSSTSPSSYDAHFHSAQHIQAQPVLRSQLHKSPQLSTDCMTVDETPHKIYIQDLESEIASIEAAENASMSHLHLPADFEKQITAIPDHVLRSNRGSPIEHGNSSMGLSSAAGGASGGADDSQALILYKDPSSISVPEEEDAVRKAILEARRGIRERMRREQQRERETARVGFGGTPSSLEIDQDSDTMNTVGGLEIFHRGRGRDRGELVRPRFEDMGFDHGQDGHRESRRTSNNVFDEIDNDHDHAGDDDADAMDLE